MKIVHNVPELREQVRQQKAKGKRVSFVSTMGALHTGHTSLVTKARTVSDYVVASIFLNPLHFSENEDYDTYPRTFEKDCAMLAEVGCDLVWAPSVEEMYPFGFEGQARVKLAALGAPYCGKSRPHLFEAIATVVTKEFNAVQPDVALFGEKDFQQLVVCRRMVEDLLFPIEVVAAPTVREENGLAKSSRNQYLTASEKETAAKIYQALLEAKGEVERGARDYDHLSVRFEKRLRADGFVPDYFEFANMDTLAPARTGDKRILILAAAYLNKVRLIDNVTVELT